MSQPKITHVVSSLQTGGAEKFVVNLAREQRRQGHDVDVMSYGLPTDPLCANLSTARIPIAYAPEMALSRFELTRHIARADIVHVHSPAVIRALAPSFPPLLKPRVIYTVHGEIDPDQSLLWCAHQVARCYVDAVTAVSEAARQSVRPRYGWPVHEVSVIFNGASLPDAPMPLSNGGTLRLGTVSRLVALKNIPLLFQSIARLPENLRGRVEVVVVGDGPERATIEAAASRVNGLSCILTGNLESEEDIYPNFDILVNCSDTEGLPMSIIEAMGYGRPVVATTVGAVPDAVRHGETGWLYSPRDAKGLSEIILRLLEAPELVARAGDAARRFALAHYGIEGVAQRFKAVYGLRKYPPNG